MARIRLTIAYDGTDFHGFAPNDGVRTVGGVLTAALERVLGHPVELTVAGRTDRGVHARGQVVSFDARHPIDPRALVRALNRLCGPEIAVTEAAPVSDDFDARHRATGRTYRYRIHESPVPDPFLARTAWHVVGPLDLDGMRLAGELLVGEHDFSSFCRRNRSRPDEVLVRRVRRVAMWREGTSTWIEVEANAFCHQMVRSIVGALVAVGLGRRRASDVRAMLDAHDRHAVPQIAPPHGLTLWEVGY